MTIRFTESWSSYTMVGVMYRLKQTKTLSWKFTHVLMRSSGLLTGQILYFTLSSSHQLKKFNTINKTLGVRNVASLWFGVTTTPRKHSSSQSNFACAQEKAIVKPKKISKSGSNADSSFFCITKDVLIQGSFKVTPSWEKQRLNIFQLIVKSGKSYPLEWIACTLSYKIINI